MAEPSNAEETKEVKETPRSTAEADFTKYKVLNEFDLALYAIIEGTSPATCVKSRVSRRRDSSLSRGVDRGRYRECDDEEARRA